MLVKVVMETFVGVIDTKLFKTVFGEILEPKDIQHTNVVSL